MSHFPALSSFNRLETPEILGLYISHLLSYSKPKLFRFDGLGHIDSTSDRGNCVRLAQQSTHAQFCWAEKQGQREWTGSNRVHFGSTNTWDLLSREREGRQRNECFEANSLFSDHVQANSPLVVRPTATMNTFSK